MVLREEGQRQKVLQNMTMGVVCLIRGAQQQGLDVSTKTKVMGTDGLAEELAEELSKHGIQVQTANRVRDLGFDATLGRKRAGGGTGSATAIWARIRMRRGLKFRRKTTR